MTTTGVTWRQNIRAPMQMGLLPPLLGDQRSDYPITSSVVHPNKLFHGWAHFIGMIMRLLFLTIKRTINIWYGVRKIKMWSGVRCEYRSVYVCVCVLSGGERVIVSWERFTLTRPTFSPSRREPSRGCWFVFQLLFTPQCYSLHNRPPRPQSNYLLEIEHVQL